MIKIHKSTNNQYYYTVHAKNGKVLVTSETMKTMASIYKSVLSLRDNMGRFYGLFELTWKKKKTKITKDGIHPEVPSLSKVQHK